MAARRQLSQTEKDAAEFGVGVRCGGWRLGLLVARNVAPAKAGRPKADENHSQENEKISMNRFAELAGVSPSQVKYHWDAWEFASQAGLVPSADLIHLGDEDVCIDVDAIEDEENSKTHWSFFYRMAKNPPEKSSGKKDSEAKTESKEKSSKPEPKVSDKEIDEDFGVEVTKDEVAEADSVIQRNSLLEILETIQSAASRMARIDGTVTGENVGLLSQISSAAMDLSTMSISLGMVTEQDKDNQCRCFALGHKRHAENCKFSDDIGKVELNATA